MYRTASKNVNWFYNNSVSHENNIINLVGFIGNGSIISSPVDYGQYLSLSFDMLVHENPQRTGAVLDVDFYDESKRFISAVFVDNQISFTINEPEGVKPIAVIPCDKDWVNVKVVINLNKVVISIGEHSFGHVFKDVLAPTTIAFGNNHYPKAKRTEPSFSIKDVEVRTEYGSFSLFIDKLGVNTEY